MEEKRGRSGSSSYTGVMIFFSILIIIFVVGVILTVLGVCPPAHIEPQPPWCVNPEVFEREMSFEAVSGYLMTRIMGILPVRDEGESFYRPEHDDVDYIPKPDIANEYSVMMGVAPNDFFWPVCRSFLNCIDPRRGVVSTFSRISSIGSDFVVITDYARISVDKEIFEDSTALSEKEIKKKMDAANEYGLKTMVLINLFLDDSSARHTSPDKSLEDGSVLGRSLILKAVDNYAPNDRDMNLLFNNWQGVMAGKAERMSDADYIVVNPEDVHFHFLRNPGLMNRNNRELISKARDVYGGKVCMMVKSLDYWISDFPELDYYKDADCIVIGGHFSFDVEDSSAESFEDFFEDYFSQDFFEENKDIEIFQMISAFSYDSYPENGWFEIWDYESLGLDYSADFRMQANIYEGFFRALHKTRPPIKGVFHYGYWWEDIDFPDEDYITRVDMTNSIRNKDAEHIFYRWAQVFGE